jgi:RNA-directed DNA polymerase
MITENRRKKDKPKAQAISSERNLPKYAEGAMVIKAGTEQSTLSNNVEHYVFIPTIEHIITDANIQEATCAVKRNKGAPGVDGVTVSDIDDILRKQLPEIKKAILEGKYYPQLVKRVEIPKPDGKGIRKLGIPTVLDRIIQQAILQVITPVFEVAFSNYSFGFRPYRSAHQAVLQAQKYIQEGYEWVIDIDLEKFFDKVNHDMLMARVARKVKDKKILLLIRRFLESGIMENGLIIMNEEGTPQGGPLSPLLSNIMLDDFDKELEGRGHRFCRYADDCNIYVKSEKAGRRVMESVIKYLTSILKLKVNLEKSAVDRPWNRKFLGFSFTQGKEPNRIKVHESRIKRFKDKVRESIKKAKGSNITVTIKRDLMPVVRGWFNYFSLAEARSIFASLDGWIRRKLRGALWKQWKKPRRRIQQLVILGRKKITAKKLAYSSKGSWRLAKSEEMHRALSNKFLEDLGFIPMMKMR